MSEEKKILDVSEAPETPTPPKKRGRKKKIDNESTTKTVEDNTSDVADINQDCKGTKNIASPVKESDNEVEIADTTDKDGVTEIINEDNTSEPNAEEDCPTAPDTDCDISSDGVTDTEAENTADGDTEDSDAETEDTFKSIEHFSDTYEIKYLSDEVDTENSKNDDGATLSDDKEYENLTILEEAKPEIKREPKQKRVREVSPDYKEYNEKEPRHVDARFDLIELFVYTLVIIMLITTFFFKHSAVSGRSMESTLSDRDHLIISDFLYKPKQFDIVVLHDPEANDDPVVKRIIALGGQTVRLERKLVTEKSSEMFSYYKTDVYVDGVAVPDKYCFYDGTDNIYPDTINESHELVEYAIDEVNPERFSLVVFEYKVPEGEIYVLGDHRNDSKDSRKFGSVNENKILGRVLIRIFPFDSFGTVE